MPAEALLIVIDVQYEDFFAGRELAEILEICDETVWEELFYEFGPFPPYYLGYSREGPPPIFCISQIKSGSLHIVGIIGTLAAKYCYDRFKRGFRRSSFRHSIEELGRLTGEASSRIIERLNKRLEEYLETSGVRPSNIKNIKARRGPP